MRYETFHYVYPDWLSEQVEGQEGSLLESVVPNVLKFVQSLEKWMSEIKI
jgi:hypothetical protein